MVNALRGLVNQINAAVFTREPATAVLDMGNHRITGVVDPANPSDVVTLNYLKRAFRGAQNGQSGRAGTGGGGGDKFYEMLFYSNGTGVITTGTTIAPAYNVGTNRDGDIEEVNIGALVAGTGTDITANLLVWDGTSTTTVLSTDIVLPAGTTDIVRLAVSPVVPVVVGNQVILSITQVGSTFPGALVTVAAVVKRNTS